MSNKVNSGVQELPPTVDVFSLIAQICLAMDAAPLDKHEGCWELIVDDQWTIAVNGHKTPQVYHSRNGMSAGGSGFTVNPVDAYVEYNGWAAGTFNPFGGILAAGEGANEDTLIAALEKKLAEVQEGKR